MKCPAPCLVSDENLSTDPVRGGRDDGIDPSARRPAARRGGTQTADRVRDPRRASPRQAGEPTPPESVPGRLYRRDGRIDPRRQVDGGGPCCRVQRARVSQKRRGAAWPDFPGGSRARSDSSGSATGQARFDRSTGGCAIQRPCSMYPVSAGTGSIRGGRDPGDLSGPDTGGSGGTGQSLEDPFRSSRSRTSEDSKSSRTR